jgi:DNA-binding transcriptional regulator YiaG
MNWERGRTSPAIRHVPRILAFLGYVPFAASRSLPERLRTYRQINGLSQAKLARQLGVDEETVRKWESGRSRPGRKHFRNPQLV